MRKDCSNMDGVIEQFDAVSSMTPIGNRFDQDNFYPANGVKSLRRSVKKSIDSRQKRKATDAKARLVASKGLAKGAQSDKELLKVLSPTKKEENKKGLSTFAKVSIGVGIVAILGIGAYFLLKKK
jgi:hypothetical protein